MNVGVISWLWRCSRWQFLCNFFYHPKICSNVLKARCFLLDLVSISNIVIQSVIDVSFKGSQRYLSPPFQISINVHVNVHLSTIFSIHTEHEERACIFDQPVSSAYFHTMQNYDFNCFTASFAVLLKSYLTFGN